MRPPRSNRSSGPAVASPSRPTGGLGASTAAVLVAVLVAGSCSSDGGSSAGTTAPPASPASPATTGAGAVGTSTVAPTTGGGTGATAPLPPDGDVSAVLLAWSDGVVGTVNQFTRQSRDAANPEARRSLYLVAWDGLAAITPWVEAAAVRAPATMQPALQAAASDVAAELSDGRQSAVDLPDASYEYRGVRNGKLFTTSEKSRIIVTRTLDNLRDELGVAAVPTGCGRQTEPVTLPVVTAP